MYASSRVQSQEPKPVAAALEVEAPSPSISFVLPSVESAYRFHAHAQLTVAQPQGRASLRLDDSQVAAAAQADKALARILRYVVQRAEASARECAKAAAAEKQAASADARELQHGASDGRPASTEGGAASTVPAGSSAPPVQTTGSPAAAPPVRVPKGLYLHGPVGAGKTMIINMMLGALRESAASLSVASAADAADAADADAHAPAPVLTARRVHFHTLLMEIHARLHALRVELPADDPSSPSDRDLIRRIAGEVASEATVLFLDDFELVDIADAFILELFLRTLCSHGTVLVTTSNWAPEQLYKDGLNREHFEPFLRMMHAVCRVHELKTVDYRALASPESASSAVSSPAVAGHGSAGSSTGSSTGGQSAVSPAPDAYATASAYLAAAGGGTGTAGSTVIVPIAHGRSVTIRDISNGAGAASFADVCGQALGPADYTSLALRFSALVLEDLPTPFTPAQHNELRRLIQLVDVFSDLRCAVLLRTGSGDSSASSSSGALGESSDLSRVFGQFAPTPAPVPEPTPAPTLAPDVSASSAASPSESESLSISDAPAGTLSAHVEDTSIAALRMGVRRALSRLREMRVRGGGRSFDALSRQTIVGELHASVLV